MPRYTKTIIAILFALAAVLGIWQRNPELLSPTSSSYIKEQSANDDQSADYFYQTGQQLKKTTSGASTTFLAVGDIMLSREVAAMIQNKKDTLLSFRNIESLLRSTDFNFGNLESPFSGKETYLDPNQFIFNVPPKNVEGLKAYNFKVLSTANNHAMDQDVAGITYTTNILDKNGISHVGSGTTLDDAWKPVLITSNGLTIGFIAASYTSSNRGVKSADAYVARTRDADRLNTAIQELRDKADFIVVSMHAGVEYTREPTEQQTTFARAAINAGADMVIGAHPHWIQPIENYKGKYIFYSLGNFIFDQEWSRETKEGLTLKISLSKTGTPLQGSKLSAQLQQIELLPVVLEHYCCPRLASPTESEAILKKIGVTNPIIRP